MPTQKIYHSINDFLPPSWCFLFLLLVFVCCILFAPQETCFKYLLMNGQLAGFTMLSDRQSICFCTLMQAFWCLKDSPAQTSKHILKTMQIKRKQTQMSTWFPLQSNLMEWWIQFCNNFTQFKQMSARMLQVYIWVYILMWGPKDKNVNSRIFQLWVQDYFAVYIVSHRQHFYGSSIRCPGVDFGLQTAVTPVTAVTSTSPPRSWSYDLSDMNTYHYQCNVVADMVYQSQEKWCKAKFSRSCLGWTIACLDVCFLI